MDQEQQDRAGLRKDNELRIYTAEEAARILRVTGAMVRAYIAAGSLPAARIGHRWRILHKDLVAFLDEQGAGGGEHRRRNGVARKRDRELYAAKRDSKGLARDVFQLRVVNARGNRAQVDDGADLVWVDTEALDYLVDRLESLNTDEAVRAYERWSVSARASLEK